MLTLIAIAAVAMVTSLTLTPGVRSLARRWSIVDHPDGSRKLHSHAMPLGGGVAVLLGMLFGLSALMISGSPWGDRLLDNWQFVLALTSAAVVIVLIGLLDDRFGLRGRQKLVGQAIAVSILVFSGLSIRHIQVFHWNINLEMLAIPFTFFWLLGAINALNLIDGVDGLATSVGIILSSAVAAAAMMNGHEMDAIVAVAVAGSLLGFLRYNLTPASIYLGDAGSMLIGLMIGALAIRCTLKGPATVALAAPAAIWAIPIFDASMAILRRKLTGRSLYATDRGHLHHCLIRHGYSNRTTLIWISVLCALTAAGALASIYQQDERLALASVALVLCTLVVFRIFGHDEFILLLRRIRHLTVSLFHFRIRPINGQPRLHTQPEFREFHTRLEGSNRWEELWQQLVQQAKDVGVHRLQLNVHFPAMHVDYHATWSQTAQSGMPKQCHIDIPMLFAGMTVGRLKISGPPPEGSVCHGVSELIMSFKELELELTQVFQQLVESESRDVIAAPHINRHADLRTPTAARH
ncbi:MAG: MraY family glycosyltransferase [Planctomycetaceae bacterium]